ncbi:MAG: phosphoribosylglycinamide formyltransferase [Candidatus Omnitrophica bacterium]|jgi:phosphoribosylglycinamide formyltransferase-1|nr:phosphoribosylglycinamide formyltransferase [Candidatus Omnitrophota bacterium]
MKKNIAVFASGKGSNFSAIAQAVKKGVLKGSSLKLLVCDTPKAPVLGKAKKAGINILLAPRKDFPSKEAFEAGIIKHLKNSKIDLIVLAGFMRILSPSFIRAYPNRIINIHPSLLPAFKGEHGIKDAFDYGVRFTGVTVHFVDEETDHGPIILQSAVGINRQDTLKNLEARIHRAEHKLYPQAIKLFLSRRLKVNGRKVKIL